MLASSYKAVKKVETELEALKEYVQAAEEFTKTMKAELGAAIAAIKAQRSGSSKREAEEMAAREEERRKEQERRQREAEEEEKRREEERKRSQAKDPQMAKYYQLLRSCEERGSKFQDMEFPPG